MKIHEEGRHDEEEKVGHGVDELSNIGREGVVLLAPVNGAGPWVEVVPHTRSIITVHNTCKYSLSNLRPANSSN